MAVPVGKLKKVSNLPPIIVESPPAPQPVLKGIDGRDGLDGVDGRDAPSLDIILSAVLKDGGLRSQIASLIEREIGKQTLGSLVGEHKGGAGFHPSDLPGYKKAGCNKTFGINSDGVLGFWTIGEIEVAEYTRLIDTDGNYKYVGEALPGTVQSGATWRIKRIEFIGGNDDDIEVLWADGVSTFSKVWDDRATYIYS